MIGTCFEERMNYARKFMPEIIELLHLIFIEIGWGDPIIEDMELSEADTKYNTDLRVTFPWGTLEIAVRVREWDKKRWRYYMQEFTFRVFLARNRKLIRDQCGYVLTDTELKKMVDGGYGDVFVYCIADPTDTRIASIYVGDSRVFRDYNKHFEIHSGEGMARITHKTPDGKTVVDDEAPIIREWDINNEHVAGNTGCGFCAYKKEGRGAIPNIPGFERLTIYDKKFPERWGDAT